MSDVCKAALVVMDNFKGQVTAIIYFFSQEQGRGTQVKLKAVTQINMQSVEKQVFFWNETSSWLVEMGK